MTGTSHNFIRFCKRIIAAAALPVVIAMFGTASAMANVSGAIFTTDSTCTQVNGNIYATKDDVYLNGGPQHKSGSAGLDDGSYCVQVTDPSGATVLGRSAPGAVTVSGGEFVKCYKLSEILNTGSSSYTTPGYDDTPNKGGEYKVWVSTTTDCATFIDDISKTDNFKVRSNVTGCDDGGPVCISCPLDFSMPCSQPFATTAVVTYADPIVSGAPGASCTPPSGSPFTAGTTTTVTCTVTNADGTTATHIDGTAVTCSFDVQLGGCPSCVFTCPPSFTNCTDAGTCTFVYNFLPPSCSDVPGVTVTCTNQDGTVVDPSFPFPLGTNTVTCRASDPAVPGSPCSFTVVVKDCVGPTITCPTTTTFPLGCNPTEPTCDDAKGKFGPGAVSDNCDQSPTLSCTAGDISSDGCNRSRVFTVKGKDASGNLSEESCLITFTWTVRTAPVLSGCPDPATASYQCFNDVPAAPTVTASDECGSVEVHYQQTQSKPGSSCTNIITRIWTATACGGTTSCTNTIKVADNTPPKIYCPKDITLAGDDCSPTLAGTATATDNCDGPLTPIPTDKVTVSGCARVIKRTWTATDSCGNVGTCTQTITCLPKCLVTNTERCCFDCDATKTGQQFRLIFTQDPNSPSCYKLNASNPGQFFYNVFQTGTPGDPVALTITLPYPFVTQGTVPVHVYDAVTVYGNPGPLDGTCPATTCLTPGNDVTGGFTISGPPVSVTRGALPGSSKTITVTGLIPASGVAFVAVHIDYGLKVCTGYNQNTSGDAIGCALPNPILIPNNSFYIFSVSGSQACSAPVQSFNVFKKNPGVGGFSNKQSVVDGATVLTPVGNCAAVLSTASPASSSNTLVKTTTDQDGYYMCTYKYTGKATTLYITITPPGGKAQTKSITIKSNGFVQVDFICP